MGAIAKAMLFLSFVLVTACGLPVNQMTAQERKADMQWAFSVFKHNYAPAELKKSNFGVELSQVEADCVALAEAEMDNPAFTALFQKCIHLFKDAHVGAQQMNNGLLPEYAQVAHLGFFTMRTKANVDGKNTDALRIVAPLKGSDDGSAPLVPGDLIIRVNEKSVSRYLQDEIFPYINVGQDETSLTIAAFRFGVRTSIDMAIPEDDSINLVVARGPMVFSIELPWIKDDLLAFQLKQNPPEENIEEDAESQEQNLLAQSEEVFAPIHTVDDVLKAQQSGLRPKSITGLAENPLSHSFIGYSEVKDLLALFETPIEFVNDRLNFIALTGFQLVKFNPLMKKLFNGEILKANGGDVIQARSLPFTEKATDLMADPLFTAKSIETNDGDVYAYIQLKNFPADDKILIEWHRAITAIQDKGIKSVIIDLIDNGGGSLVHGMRMANMLRKKPLKYPSLQVRLNNNWVNTFKSQAAFAENDYNKAIARGVVKDLEEDMAQGKSISRPISVKVLDPFFLQNPMIGLTDDVKVALLVNELCVSMCDIFASVFQTNNMGQIIGQRTMGGGGNVVQHGLSPISKMGMALTESLVITPEGQYIEDEGVTPDVLVDMVADREKGFATAFSKALDHILEH